MHTRVCFPNAQVTRLHMIVCHGCASAIPRTLPAITATFKIYGQTSFLDPHTLIYLHSSDISDFNCLREICFNLLNEIKKIILFNFAWKMWCYSFIMRVHISDAFS